MRRYPEYKASGVEWVGEIPEHWKMQRAKFIFRRLQRPIREHDEIITAFRDGIVTLRKNRRTLGFTNSLKEIGYQGLRKGDLVVHAMDGHAGAIGVSDSDGKSSPVYSVCRPISQENVYYYAYLLRYMALSGFIESLTRGVRERSTEFRFNEFKEIDLLIPPISEQTQIANFLDQKMGQIDELIRIKERRIELLQEQRTTLINQAVTKGLDPNVEMKPSGAEWIGEIPAHWEVKRVKYLASLISKGTTPTTIGREILDEGEIRFIKAENIVDNQTELKPEYYIDEKTNQMLKRSQLKENDLLFVIAGATIGKVSLVNPNHLPANTNQAVSFIRPHEKELPEFIYYWLQSSNIQKMIWLKAVQSAQPNLSMEDLGNLYIPYPNIAEQRRIVDYIAGKTQTIVQLLQQAYRQIELLKEYRQSLISEAVTGKIDVRNEV